MRDQRISYAQAAYDYDTAEDPSLDDEQSDDGDDWNGYSDGFELID